MKSTKETTTQDEDNPIQAVVNVNSGAYHAQKQVNMAIMRKIGQLIIAQKPQELVVAGEKIYWKVPLSIANLTGDDEKYPLQSYALVDAITLRFDMSNEFAQRIITESTPTIRRLYPELKAWEKQVENA